MIGRLGWAILAVCASAVRADAQPLADRAPLGGVVVDDAGQPVAALVTVRRQEDLGPTSFWGTESRADERGQFRVPQAQEGRYFLNIEAPGYAPLSNVPLDWNRHSAPLHLSLQRLTRALLHVSRADGTPLSGEPVWVRLRSSSVDLLPLRATTDARGEVVVPDVTPGTFRLIVVAAQGIAVQRAVALRWATGGAPVDVRLSEGATLKIKAHDSAGLNLGGASLSLFPQSPDEAARLSGEGADAGENWALLAAANAPQALVSHESDGALELKGVPAGHFAARLSLPGYEVISRDIEAKEGESVEWDAQFPARPGATWTLAVRDSSGAPVANTLVALRLLPLAADGTFASGSPFDDVTPFDAGAPFFTLAPGARVGRTDDKGQLKLFPLRAGRYRVFASRPAAGEWLRAPVAPEGAPVDVTIALDGTNAASVQVP